MPAAILAVGAGWLAQGGRVTHGCHVPLPGRQSLISGIQFSGANS